MGDREKLIRAINDVLNRMDTHLLRTVYSFILGLVK